MGGSDMPYLYTPTTPTSNTRFSYPYSDFNPKAVTQSYARLSQQTTNTSASNSPSKKKEGPLINFNQHPDSYVVYAGTNQHDHKPVHRGAKKAIVWSRWAMLGLRVLTEIAAVGLLVCTICIQHVDGAQKYLLRIPVSLLCHG